MNASAYGLAIAVLLTLSPVASAEVAIIRPGGFAHADHFRRGPEFGREDHRFFRDRDERFADRDDRFRERFGDRDERFRHDRRNSDLGWGGFDGGAYYGSPVADAAPAQFFAGPSLGITITIAPPAAPGSREARMYARPSGPRIITIGAASPASSLEKLPIVIYGRQVPGETD
jgi:hypothetical protein